MVKCSVKLCTRNARDDIGISFFRFPAESARCDEWMRALGRPDLQGINADKMHQSKYRVCSVHFHSNDFSSMLMNRLKREAVPILFPAAAGQGPFFPGGEPVEGDKYITFTKNGTEPSDTNEIIESANTDDVPREKTEDSQNNSENNSSNDVPSEENTNLEEKMEVEENSKVDVNSGQEKSNDDCNEVTKKPIENGIREVNDVDETNNVENETEEDNNSEAVLDPALSSQNEENDEEDDDFNPLLLCPDISMDVDESPVLTSAEAESIPPSASDMIDSNALFAPLFSTFVDEMTGAEISFNLTSEEQQLREKLYGPNNPIQYSKIHCTACNVHLGSALAGQTNRFVHPLLKVLICKECYHFYTSGEFEKDEDGSELYCRWCGQGGQVLCCTMCEFVFCKKCIRINFGRKKLTEVRDSDDWKCFRCDISQLKALRAMCVEFFEYVRKATARAASSSDPDYINKDLTNCCQTQLKKRLGEPEVEQEKETAAPMPKRQKRKKNEEDPDYNPFARQDTPEPPSEPVASTSGMAPAPAAVRPLPPLLPKPTINEVTFPGQSPSPTVRIGNTVLNVKSTSASVAGAAVVQARQSPGFAPRTPNTAIRHRQNFASRTPSQASSPRPPNVPPVTVGPSSIQAKPNPPKPMALSMKHEWFEKTVRAAARVNSNLSYTLTQLNKAQASASSVEQLAVVHNKLQEILSSSINSLIQIRKNLRTEFIAGIKTIRFPPKPPVDPNDDDVIIVNPMPNVSKVNQSILAGLPQISVKKNLRTPTPTRPVSNNNNNTSAATTITPNNSTPSRGYLKVKSFSQLQTVTSECITIPDDDPPTKDDEPVIVGQNIMPEVEKDPLADDPLADIEEIQKNDEEEDIRIVNKSPRQEENDQGDGSKGEEADGDKNEDQSNEEVTERNEEQPTSNQTDNRDTNIATEKEANENNKECDANVNQEETAKLPNGTLEEEVTVKKEREEIAYNVKDKPSPKIRRMLSVKVNLKKTPVVEDMVKQEPVENGDQ